MHGWDNKISPLKIKFHEQSVKEVIFVYLLSFVSKINMLFLDNKSQLAVNSPGISNKKDYAVISGHPNFNICFWNIPLTPPPPPKLSNFPRAVKSPISEGL